MINPPPAPRHLQRRFTHRTFCDQDDERVMADDLVGTTCQACRDAYERQAADWHAELRGRLRPSYEGDPGDEDETPPTRPGKALPPDDDAA